MTRDILSTIIKVTRSEMRGFRESMNYPEIEVFVGCLLAAYVREGLLSNWDEEILRREVLREWK